MCVCWQCHCVFPKKHRMCVWERENVCGHVCIRAPHFHVYACKLHTCKYFGRYAHLETNIQTWTKLYKTADMCTKQPSISSIYAQKCTIYKHAHNHPFCCTPSWEQTPVTPSTPHTTTDARCCSTRGSGRVPGASSAQSRAAPAHEVMRIPNMIDHMYSCMDARICVVCSRLQRSRQLKHKNLLTHPHAHNADIHTHTQVHLNTRMHKFMHTCAYIYAYMHKYTHAYIHSHACTCGSSTKPKEPYQKQGSLANKNW